jgi:LEA14-like dessication related protein
MKTSTLLLLAIGGYALYEFTQFGIAANTVNVVFQGLSFNSIDSVTVNLQVQNVSNASVNVNSMTGNLLMNGNQLASLSDFTQRTVPANGEVTVPITVSLSLLSLPGDISSITQLTGQTIDFKVVGNVNVNGLVLPINLDNPVTF